MGTKFIGIDFKTKCIQFYGDFYINKRTGFIEGDIMNLEMMPQEQFDIIFCIEILTNI